MKRKMKENEEGRKKEKKGQRRKKRRTECWRALRKDGRGVTLKKGRRNGVMSRGEQETEVLIDGGKEVNEEA